MGPSAAAVQKHGPGSERTRKDLDTLRLFLARVDPRGPRIIRTCKILRAGKTPARPGYT